MIKPGAEREEQQEEQEQARRRQEKQVLLLALNKKKNTVVTIIMPIIRGTSPVNPLSPAIQGTIFYTPPEDPEARQTSSPCSPKLMTSLDSE